MITRNQSLKKAEALEKYKKIIFAGRRVRLLSLLKESEIDLRCECISAGRKMILIERSKDKFERDKRYDQIMMEHNKNIRNFADDCLSEANIL